MRRSMGLAGLVLVLIVSSACVLAETPTPSSSSSSSPRPSVSAAPTSVPPTATPLTSPTPTPEPPLSLALPEQTDPRIVAASVATAVGAEAGTVTVTVTSSADERIDELVLRWPTQLNDTLFLAPFTPSDERIRDGGPPLVQTWTKWVVGPGEQGEPDGTISLGYGPLLPGATLTIGLAATRAVPDPVAFDFQLLAGNALLAFDGGTPAELRVEVP